MKKTQPNSETGILARQKLPAQYFGAESTAMPKPGSSNRIVSFLFPSKHRKAKRKGFAVDLVYQPGVCMSDTLRNEFVRDISDASDFYIRITLYNETQIEIHNLPQMSHYLPLSSLPDLFRLADAIKEDRLFDFYINMDSQDDMAGASGVNHPQYAQLERQFFEKPYHQFLFHHAYFLYNRTSNSADGCSMLQIGYCSKNELGEAVNLPWKISCLSTRYEQQAEDAPFQVWDNAKTKQTDLSIPTDWLLAMVEGIRGALGDDLL